MKKIILAIILIGILITGYIIIRTVDFGTLTINLLEKTAHVDVEYEKIEGNIFRGFTIKKYKVKSSETDSIYGETANIAYRFKPLSFRLPNLFEINLIEPTVYMKKKIAKGGKRKFTLPHFHAGLRINVKNGKMIYENKRQTIIEAISGLIFIDLVGAKVYLNTMNLSFRNREYPITITSVNLDCRIDDKAVDAKSFRIKGIGIILDGSGMYYFEKNQASFKLKRAELDLQRFGVHKGSIHFSGDVDFINNKFLPRIQGTAQGLEPIDRFNFETNVFADTISINIFDGELFGGSLFAQVKLLDQKNYEFEANFNEVDLSNIIEIEKPLVISGYLGYRNKKFIGFMKSPIEKGLGIDSLFLFGSVVKSDIFLDSLFIREGEKILTMSGHLYSECDLNIEFNNFNTDRFSKYIPLKAELNGTCHLLGNLNEMKKLFFTSNIECRDLTWADFGTKKLTIYSENFQIENLSDYLKIELEKPYYKNHLLDNISLILETGNISIKAHSNSDTAQITGIINKVWAGTISSLYIKYNGVETKNKEPISFDITNKEIGGLNLSFIGGSLKATLFPSINIDLTNGSLKKLGMMSGVKEPVSGIINLSLNENIFCISASNLDFMGLKNGSLTMAGKYKNKTVMVESLKIADENNQSCYARGFFSIDSSDINLKFSNLGTWVLPFLNDFLIEPKGMMSGDITYQGNLEKFKITGKGKIENGSFGVDEVTAQFDSVAGEVSFEADRIIFRLANALVSTMSTSPLSQKKRAHVSAGGVVKLEPRFKVKNYNFDLSFKDAPIQFQPFAFGVGSGNFSFGMKDEKSYYNGNISIKHAIVPINFGLKIKEEKGEGSENWTMNLRLRGERNIWLRNREADIEFGGELYIIKAQAPLYMSGRLETYRGNFYWLNHVLSITHGQVTFIPEEKIDAELDFWAEMNTRERHPTTGEEIKIKLHCFGSMSEPIFEFFSEPPYYSEQDILTYLNLNISWRELESMKQGAYVGSVLPGAIVSWLESDVSRRIRQYTGLDYFRIETPFFDSEVRTRVTVGKYISKDLFIIYTYDVTSFSNEFNVEYFIDDKNEILIRRDEEGEYSLQYQYRIRF